jgi:hypothetical protein
LDHDGVTEAVKSAGPSTQTVQGHHQVGTHPPHFIRLVDDIPDQRLMLLLALAAVLVASSVHLLFDDRLNLDENHSAFTDRSGVNSMASSYSIDQNTFGPACGSRP